MSGPTDNLALARQYLQAVESVAKTAELAQFFAPEVIVEIFPACFFPTAAGQTWQEFAPPRSAAKKPCPARLIKSATPSPAAIRSLSKSIGPAL